MATFGKITLRMKYRVSARSRIGMVLARLLNRCFPLKIVAEEDKEASDHGR